MKTENDDENFLIGRIIIEVGVTNQGEGYIKLDNGKTLFLDLTELDDVGEE